jgi:hypothetical protein
MMEKAGYLQRTGYRAFDSDWKFHDVIELHILGIRYAIRRTDLVKAVAGHLFVQVEEIIHNYNYYLGTTKGLAQVSVSGKALNIDIFNEGSYTVSLNTLRNVLHGRERQACIVKIPEQVLPSLKMRRISTDQKRISALV